MKQWEQLGSMPNWKFWNFLNKNHPTKIGERKEWRAEGEWGLLEHDDTFNKFFDDNFEKGWLKNYSGHIVRKLHEMEEALVEQILTAVDEMRKFVNWASTSVS